MSDERKLMSDAMVEVSELSTKAFDEAISRAELLLDTLRAMRSVPGDAAEVVCEVIGSTGEAPSRVLGSYMQQLYTRHDTVWYQCEKLTENIDAAVEALQTLYEEMMRREAHR